ncbi:nuclear transport factor 2 family protein [Crenalkalicoccus roseus]|uniref:nuclear transport factor 2 family protein n=1 Tax=Crenalkalicoccus roseus TaxID=1485588 RepID=UPI00108125E6|nr:nuclear transport factor 2 family protein [Crenalkalicoccus roseus]
MDTTEAGRPVTMELLKAISVAFNSRDVDRIMAHFAEDAVFLMASGPEPAGRTVRGKAAIRQVLAERFRVVPDMRWEREAEWLCGSRAVTVWRVTGRAADGTALDYRGCDLYEFADGLITRKDTYWKIVRPDPAGGRSPLLP